MFYVCPCVTRKPLACRRFATGVEQGAHGQAAPADLRACVSAMRGYCGNCCVSRADGTVLVLCPGHEMGQGLFTKVRQTAAMALSNVLPASQRPFPIDLINIADNASDLLPNAGARPAPWPPGQLVHPGNCQGVVW